MRLAWATDPHLNFVSHAKRRKFLDSIRAQADAWVVSDDIEESPGLIETLHEMDAGLGRPVYFVLSNHDYYHGSVAGTRRSVAAAGRSRSWRTCASRPARRSTASRESRE